MAHLFRSDRADSVALDSSRCHSHVDERSPKEAQSDYTMSVHVNNGGKVGTALYGISHEIRYAHTHNTVAQA